jgi:hypothetical protein
MKYSFTFKHFKILILLLLYPLPDIFSESNSELKVDTTCIYEGSFTIILECAESDKKEFQSIALVYIEDSIERGTNYEIVLQALEILGGTSDFPDIRIKAINLLGILGTLEAYNLLSRIIVFENNPEVVQEAQEAINIFNLE